MKTKDRTTRSMVSAGLCLVFSIAGLESCTTPSTPAPNPQLVQERVEPGAAGSAPQTPEEPGSEPPTASVSDLYPGTGKLVGTPQRPRPPATEVEEEGVTLTFRDTDIRTVVDSILGQALGLDYAIDPRIAGTLTLQSSRPLPRDALLPALESALGVQGIALVPAGAGYDLVPIAEAPQHVRSLALPVPESRRLPGFGVEIVPLQYTSPLDMQKVLEPLVPPGAILRVDQARSLLVLAGTSQELETMLDAVRIFDVDWLHGMSFALYHLEYVDAKTLTNELLEVFGDIQSPLAGVVKLVPIPRLNSIMAITSQPSYLDDIQAWVERLDLGGGSPGRRIYVYDVQNGRATDLANALNQILGHGSDASSLSDTPISDSSGAGPLTGLGNAIQGNQAAAGAVRSGLTDTEPRDQFEAVAGLRVVPNEQSNSLLILATPSEFSVVQNALRQMDVPLRQVLIEASLAEVSLTNDLRYGVQWFFEFGDGTMTLSDAGNGSVSSKFPGFSFVYTGSSDARAVLNALEAITEIDVVAAPKLMVLNNHEAVLQIGDQVPVATQSAVAVVDPSSPIVNAVQFRDTGVVLHVTPRVNKNGLVQMDITQEVSDVVPTTTSGIDSPTIQQRKVTSTVAVRSGETIALGGLIRENRSHGKSGIPFIQRVPGLGALFRSTSENSQRLELIVLITPRVVRDAEELRGVMDYLREQFPTQERIEKLNAKP